MLCVAFVGLLACQVFFVLHVRHDILVEAIETKKHDGRVCGVGQCIDLKLYFITSRKSKGLRKKDMDELIDKKLEEIIA